MITQKDFEAKEEIRALPKPIQRKLTSFIFKEIPKVCWFKPDGKPRKEWRIFYGETWDAAWGAARDAARDAVWGAARDAVRDAVWDAARDAVWDAARDAVWGAARGAAWDAVRDAVWDAARDAVWGAAWSAAWDAALISDYMITSDLSFKDKAKHLAHAKARWEVWQKGYALLCDVDGVLYVYCKGKPAPAKPLTDKEAREKLAGFEKRVSELEATAKADKDKLEKIKAILG